METLVKILHVIVCIFLMLTVLLQAGKGGGMGAAFGGGSSMGTVFGGSGAGNFLRRLTVGAAVIFMITSMTLAWMSTPTTDPVKKYMAQQYRAMMDREKAHKEAMGGAKAPATDGKQTPEEGEGVGPDEMIDTPEGTEGGEDAIDTPDGEGTEGGTSEAPETIDTPAPEPAAAKKPPAETPKPKAKPVPPPAAPVAPPPESSSTTPP